MKNKRNQKILSAILALVFILGVTTPGEILASGNYQAESDPKLEIVAFEELAAEIAAQEVPLGTKKSELNLPAILIATVKLAMEDEAAVTDAVYASDDAEFDSIIYEKDVQEEDSSAPGTMEIPVPVSWKSIPEYDGDTAGVYTFRAEISGFTLSAVPPVITVTVHEEKLQGTISSFEEFEEDLRWQNTKNPILPEKVRGIVEGKVIDIPVTWEADRDYDQNFPESGLYVFTAKLGEGYVLLPGVEAPRITVYIPPARKMTLMLAGNATETDPLIITTAAQLSEIATLVNMGRLETFIFNNNEAKVHLKIGRDIDLSSYGKNYRSGKGWMPIGTIDNPFKGQFNGDGKTIAGLYIDDRSLEYAGLFGAVSEGKIENLGLQDIYINGGDYAGGLAGYINNVTIERCYVTGTVNGDTAGGITGKVCGNSVICNCYSSVSVSGSSNAGGVAGLIESGSVESCYAMGKVEGIIAGGVAGKIENGNVENCAALNFNIAASSVVARVVGDNQGTLSNNAAFTYMTVTINNNPKLPTDEANGVDGQNIDANGIKADKTIGGRFAPEGGWTTETGKLPGLFGKAVDIPAYIEDKTDPYFIGQGTEKGPFLIATAEQLVKLAELVNKGDTTYNSAYYRLMADIDLSVYDNSNTSFNGGRGWVPIGKSGRSFSGTFDGDGHTITGLYIDDAGMSGAGLLGYVSGGTIKNIGLKNVNIKANYDVGAVSGYIENGGVENCYVTGVVECRNVIGGVVGNARNSTIKNCYATAEVISTVEANPGYYSNAGGVVGIAANSTVQGCYSAGTVNCKSNYVGGIVGQARENTSVISCAALNYSVSGSSNVGRVVGYLYSTNLVGNVGYEWILNGSGGKLSDESNPSGQHGKKISADELQYCINLPADFQSFPWNCADSVLPGLFGETVEMPTHITDRLDNQDPYFVGKGTEHEPFMIATAQQLKKLADMVSVGDTKYNSAHYKLTVDIDLSDYSTGEGWMPIGTDSNPFKGTFDGNNKRITGLRINRYPGSNIGLFGYIDGGTVRNVGLTNVDIFGHDQVGTVAGSVDHNGKVENCYSSGYVSANFLVGGLVGQVYNSSIVQNCYSTAYVKSNYNIAGGIAGWMVYNCTARYCYSSGDVRGNNVVGGLVGVLRYNSRVEYCYSTGSVSGDGEAGGVVGKTAYFGAVENCAALNSFVSGASNVGRVVGVYDTVNLSDNIAFAGMKVMLNGSDKTMDEGHDKVDGKSATTPEIKAAGFFELLFENNSAWEYGEGRLPALQGLEGQDSALPFHINGFEGKGDSNDPYLIKTAADLANLAEQLTAGPSSYADGDKYYKLENDIDLSAYGKTYREGRGWVPIGTSSRPFKGHFDGNGKEIRGLYINDSSLNYAGLFGYIAGGSVRDLGLIKVNITGRSYVGALAGLTTGTVKDCYATGSVSGNNDYVGGLIGYLDSNGEVAKCYVTGTVNGNASVGGLVAYVKSGSVENCYTAGAVSGNQKTGGIAGSVDAGILQYCYSTASVTSKTYVGGISGEVTNGGNIENCIAISPAIYGENTMGRIVGRNNGSLASNYAISEMKVNGNTISGGALDNENGKNVTIGQIYTSAFFTSSDNWENAAWAQEVWVFREGKLPVLAKLPGQSDDGGLYLNRRDIQYATVTPSSFTYNGSLQLPNIIFDGEILEKDEDYTVKITSTDGDGTSSGIKVGTVEIEITGIGNFSGTKTGITYTIERAPLTISGGNVADKIYDGTTVAEVTEVTFEGLQNGESLKIDEDYNVTYAKYDSPNAGVNKTVTAIVTLKGNGKTKNYHLEDGSLRITDQKIKEAELTILGGTVAKKTYDGTTDAVVTEVIFDGLKNGESLKIDEDYDVTDAKYDSADAGEGKTVTATVKLIGNGKANNYVLNDESLRITGQKVAKAELTIIGGTAAEKTYDGTTDADIISVNFAGLQNGDILELGTDYTIKNAKFDSEDAGGSRIVTATVTLEDNDKTKNYDLADGSLVITDQEIRHKLLKEDMVIVQEGPFTYTGGEHKPTVTVQDGSVTLEDGTDYEVTYFNNINAGTATVKITGQGNYTGEVSKEFTIEKAIQPDIHKEIAVMEKYRHEYQVNLTELLPSVSGNFGTIEFTPAVTENSEGLLGTLSYTSGDTLILPVNPVEGVNKTAKVTIKVESSNYHDFNIVITLKTTNKQLVSISGINMAGGVYNSEPYAYTGTPVFTLISDESQVNTEFTVQYQSADGGGYSSEEAPTDAGEYLLTISLLERDDIPYTGSQSYPFTIQRRPVTVKAEDKTMTARGQLPTFTYIVEGQLSGETALIGKPMLTSEADGKTAGSYPIIVDLTGVSYTPNYRAAEPAFVNGTLTVNPAPSGGGGSSGRSNSSATIPQTQIYILGNIVTVITPAEASVDKSGNLTVAFSQVQVEDAIEKGLNEARKLGEGAITNITLNVQSPTEATGIETNIPEEAIAQIAKAGINSLTVSTPVGDITFDSEVISDLEKEAGDIDIKITRVDNSSLSPEAKEVVGDRPVYDISVTVGGKVISQFEGNVTVSVPYTPKEGEDIDAIVIYYINEFGEPEVVTDSIYDPETGKVTFTTRHFSIYAIGYNKVTFKDVSEKAWYSKAVTFIAARGITTGTGSGNFSPEAKLTRGQFIVMLMKAYGIAPDKEAKDNFQDAGNTYYTGYLAGAKRLNISKGVGNNEFKPEKDITRQEMFTLLYNALKVIGKLPEKKAGSELSAFADADAIASWAKEAMEYLVESGIISGNGGRLNPTDTTTRAEMAQVLYNLLSIVKPITARLTTLIPN